MVSKYPRLSKSYMIPQALCIGSMYDVFPYIWLIFMVNVGKYTIHGSYGLCIVGATCSPIANSTRDRQFASSLLKTWTPDRGDVINRWTGMGCGSVFLVNFKGTIAYYWLKLPHLTFIWPRLLQGDGRRDKEFLKTPVRDFAFWVRKCGTKVWA